MEKSFTFAQRLQALIDMKGISKSEIARACGIDRSNITRYLDGEYEAKQDVIFRLSQKYGVNEAWLMGYDIPIFKEEGNQDYAQQERDEALLESFRELPPEEQEIVIAQTRGLAHRRKGLGIL